MSLIVPILLFLNSWSLVLFLAISIWHNPLLHFPSPFHDTCPLHYRHLSIDSLIVYFLHTLPWKSLFWWGHHVLDEYISSIAFTPYAKRDINHHDSTFIDTFRVRVESQGFEGFHYMVIRIRYFYGQHSLSFIDSNLPFTAILFNAFRTDGGLFKFGAVCQVEYQCLRYCSQVKCITFLDGPTYTS